MAAPTVQEMREGLRDALDRVFEYQTSAYMLSNPTPPTIYVLKGRTNFDKAMGRGYDEHTFTVQAIVGETSAVGAAQLLDSFRGGGAGTVKAAVEADKTLGGLVDGLRVTEESEDKVFVLEGRGPFIGCDWTVVVMATGK